MASQAEKEYVDKALSLQSHEALSALRKNQEVTAELHNKLKDSITHLQTGCDKQLHTLQNLRNELRELQAQVPDVSAISGHKKGKF